MLAASLMCYGSRCGTIAASACIASPLSHVIVHLIDGTYELFRHFYGLRRFNKGEDQPFGAVVGVLEHRAAR